MIHYPPDYRWLQLSAAITLLASLLLISLTGHAATLQPEQSQIQFAGTQMGRSFTGEISRFDASAQFSAARRLTRFTLAIPATALVSGNQQRDSTLQTTDWLDSKRHPTLRFEGEVHGWHGDTGTLEGVLTIKGTGLPMTLKVIQSVDDGIIQLATEGKIDRIPYQLGTGDWLDTKTVGQTIQFSASLRFKD